MTKKILITGKRNIDSFKKEKGSRKVSEKWENIKAFKNIDILKQIELLNKLYLEEEYEGSNFVKKEIIRKIRSYKNQDTKKQVYNGDYFIKYDEIMEKLVVSKLKCYYCRYNCLLIYEKIREKKQWTLDRIDNDKGHNNDNVVICCLECNLKKGTKNDKHFKFAKQMRIIKKY
jgi:hypothetical protein